MSWPQRHRRVEPRLFGYRTDRSLRTSSPHPHHLISRNLKISGLSSRFRSNFRIPAFFGAACSVTSDFIRHQAQLPSRPPFRAVVQPTTVRATVTSKNGLKYMLFDMPQLSNDHDFKSIPGCTSCSLTESKVRYVWQIGSFDGSGGFRCRTRGNFFRVVIAYKVSRCLHYTDSQTQGRMRVPRYRWLNIFVRESISTRRKRQVARPVELDAMGYEPLHAVAGGVQALPAIRRTKVLGGAPRVMTLKNIRNFSIVAHIDAVEVPLRIESWICARRSMSAAEKSSC